MNLNALFSVSYGLYIISTTFEGQDAACIVNTLQQVTAEPPRLAVAVHNDNYTCELMKRSGVFGATVLTRETDMNLLRYFGFRSSRDVNKFEGRAFDRDSSGVPYLTEHMAARFSCAITQELALGSHTLFVGELKESEAMAQEEVMTYDYYHKEKKGITPPKASSYQAKAPKQS